MAISGIRLTLDPDPAARVQTLELLGSRSDVQLGPRVGQLIAAVLDTPGPEADRRALEELLSLPGVCHVDVVAIFYPESDPEPDVHFQRTQRGREGSVTRSEQGADHE